MIVEDEDVTPQGMDTAGVHRCILGKGMMEDEMEKRQTDVINLNNNIHIIHIFCFFP